jgi:hypothetical protein
VLVAETVTPSDGVKQAQRDWHDSYFRTQGRADFPEKPEKV